MSEQNHTAPDEQGGASSDPFLNCNSTPNDTDLPNWAELQSAARSAAEAWQERVAKYHSANGKEAPLPKDAYRHHPACEGLASLLSRIFIIATQDEVERWAMDALARISRDEKGDIQHAGRGPEGIAAQIDNARRSAKIAATSGDIGNASLADQNMELGECLNALLWGTGEVEQMPLTIAIREALA